MKIRLLLLMRLMQTLVDRKGMAKEEAIILLQEEVEVVPLEVEEDEEGTIQICNVTIATSLGTFKKSAY